MIRKASPADAKGIAQVHIKSWQQAYCDLMPAEYLNALDATLARREFFWMASIESGESNVWVAQVDGQVVGWIAVGASRDDDGAAANAGEVMALYVVAAHWQTGVGPALWNAGVQYLSEQGFEQLTLWVLAGNDRAIRFYRRAGCVEEAGSERNLERGGVKLVEVRYRLPRIPLL
jgi:ribosomal protein S18 acetylase RimI-like enzyme